MFGDKANWLRLKLSDQLVNLLELSGGWKEVGVIKKDQLAWEARYRGSESPAVLWRTESLLDNYLFYEDDFSQDEARKAEAKELAMSLYQKQKILSGEEHPDLLPSMMFLACIYTACRDFEQANDFHRRIVELQTTVSVPVHPETLLARSNRAISNSMAGRLEEAETELTQVLSTALQSSSKTTEHIIGSLNTVAKEYAKRKRNDEAEKLQTEVARSSELVLGEHHPLSIGYNKRLSLIRQRLARKNDSIQDPMTLASSYQDDKRQPDMVSDESQ